MAISERLRRRLEWRRSNAAQPHKNKYRSRYDDADWLAEAEADIDAWEAGEFNPYLMK